MTAPAPPLGLVLDLQNAFCGVGQAGQRPVIEAASRVLAFGWHRRGQQR